MTKTLSEEDKIAIQLFLAEEPCGGRPLLLTYKGLTDFPEFLLSSKDISSVLKVLYLGRNLISRVPEDIPRLKALTGLHINHNKLQFLPKEIGELVNLDTLNVAGNHLEYLPNEIGKLQKLQKLELYNNTLKRLPICIGNLSELRVLEAANNLLSNIPIELSRCKKLVTLNFDNNNLTFLPRQLQSLEKLVELSVNGNNLYILPQEIGKIESLFALYVDKNSRLYTLPASLVDKEIGFYSCGTEPIQNELLENICHVLIQHTLTEKIPLVLPLDFNHVYDTKDCIPTLLELTLRKCSEFSCRFLDVNSDTDLHIPKDLLSLLTCPTATCEICNRPIFTSGFPVVYKHTSNSVYFLGLCCSLLCYKQCYFTRRRHLPVIFPSAADLQLALVLLD